MRWAIGLTLLTVFTLMCLWVARLFTAEGLPAGDRRACKGTVLSLNQALATYELDLPAGATDLHHLARVDPESGRLQVAVALRSTRAAMTDYLQQHGLTADQLAHLDDSAYPHGDVADYAGLCGNTAKVPAVSVPLKPVTSTESARVAVELDGRAIRENTAVVLAVVPT
ncbi:hypothetical protein ACFYS8_32475 [Kitasatospora sp. NPDC004615]|uniref:hypothetical protein n=1 Tax=Kitasatospora sp. NPDC004615 TaxID=3364017 RepID=UPI0036A7CB8E